MNYVDRAGRLHKEQGTQDRLLSCIYGSGWGRCLVRLLVRPGISRIAGAFLDTRLSRCLIGPFIRWNRLDMSPYRRKKAGEFASYNDFFTRELLPGLRPVAEDPRKLPAPCDGRVTVYPIHKDTSFTVKHTRYTVETLLKNKELAGRFAGGYAVILRLCVTDYHRYIYPVTGEKSGNHFIPGILHTVNPAAVETEEVFKENAREYTLIRNREFGTLLQMEVGALLVGRICNDQEAGPVRRGEEKGRFEFGGSTVILLLQKDKVLIRKELLANTARGWETQVMLGEEIGLAK